MMTPQPPLEGYRRSQRLLGRHTQMRALNRPDPGSRQLDSRSAILKQIHGSGNGDGRLLPSTTALQGRTGRCKQVNRPTRPLQDISVNRPVKKQQGRKRSSNSPTSFSEPLPTDPASTAILWQQVRACSLADMAPPKVSLGQKLVSLPPTRTSSHSRGGKSVSSAMTTSTFSQSATDFREKILRPRGIVFTDRSGLQGQRIGLDGSPYSYFRTRLPPPETSSADHYNGDHGSPWSPIKSKVWLDASESSIDRIAEEYRIMNVRQLCEAEFALFTREELLRQDHRVLDPDTRSWTVDRMVKPTLKPGGLLEVPPIVEKGEDSVANFQFHFLPDCMYWISLHGFNADYRWAIKRFTHVIDDSEVTCPYLTVEFKKDGTSEDQAKNQVARASALMLYNRYHLRLARLKAQKAQIDQSSFENVMHFGLTFWGADCDIYICQPTLTEKGEWKGCRMCLVASYHCTESFEVKYLLEWLNEIHFWGMHVHGKGCEDDLKGYFLASLRYSGKVSEVGHRPSVAEDVGS